MLIFGRSIGGGPAVEMTSRHPREVAGLILESPFLSVFRVVNESVATCLCCCDVFKNVEKVPSLEIPVMLPNPNPNPNPNPHWRSRIWKSL